MTTSHLIAISNSNILALQTAKAAKSKAVASLAAIAATQEGLIAEAQLASGNTEGAVISLVSCASCLVDAQDYSEALKTFRRAVELAPTTRLLHEIEKLIQDVLRRNPLAGNSLSE